MIEPGVPVRLIVSAARKMESPWSDMEGSTLSSPFESSASFDIPVLILVLTFRSPLAPKANADRAQASRIDVGRTRVRDACETDTAVPPPRLKSVTAAVFACVFKAAPSEPMVPVASDCSQIESATTEAARPLHHRTAPFVVMCTAAR